jgi:hypothetical protein
MRKWVHLFFILTILSGFLLGCTKSFKDSIIKCPKCGTFFSTEEGAEEFRRMQANPDR